MMLLWPLRVTVSQRSLSLGLQRLITEAAHSPCAAEHTCLMLWMQYRSVRLNRYAEAPLSL